MIKDKLANIATILTIFCVARADVAHAQTFVYGSLYGTAGRSPNAGSGSVQGLDGNLYGTLPLGGGGDGLASGTVYKLTPTGEFTALYAFCFPYQLYCPDGQQPSTLVMGMGGNFYGTTQNGGIYQAGTAFKITPGGQFTTLYTFCSKPPGCKDGAYPLGTLVQGRDGSLYGTASQGGAVRQGILFKITPAGHPVRLYDFCSQPNCADGSGPAAGLVLGNDGNFYGTTQFGGKNSGGTVFKVTPTGQLTTLYSFCSRNNCEDGYVPAAPLVQGTDGNLYGTTQLGGTNDRGTAFQLDLNGVLTILHNFCSDCAGDGAYPSALIQANDGNLYGVTSADAYDWGSIFQITPDGSFTLLHEFCPGQQNFCAEGQWPASQLTQSTDASFYGGASAGGNPTPACGGATCGTIFRLSTGLPPFIRPNPVFGKAGQTINILGSNLTGATRVTFNGVSASFEATDIKAEVPAAATTGTLRVTTPGGTLSADVAFQVLP